MARLSHDLRGSRWLLPVVGLLALAMLVSGAVVFVVHRLGSEGRYPQGKNDAKPAELVPNGSPAPKPSRRPNIVTIVTDDMRTDDIRWMPDVRRLLEDRGLNFRNSFAPNPSARRRGPP